MAKRKRNILVIAAHPDDEILGCGATMARHAAEGDHVHIVIMAEGLTSRDNKRDRVKHESGLSALRKAARSAGRIIGAQSVTLHNFPDNRMDGIELLDVIKIVEAEVSRLRPDTVYTHFYGDVNVDHRVVHEAVVTACRPQPGHSVQRILYFEIPSSTEWRCASPGDAFVPNWFTDVGRFLDRKLRALKAYASEMRKWPHARSPEAVEALARWRGASAGYKAAEAFVLGRRRK